MIEQCIKYMPLLGIAAILNVLFGLYNNIAVKKQKFQFGVFFQGIVKAILFSVGIFGVSYIMDHMEIPLAVMTPEVILETGTLYYTSKVLAHIYKIIIPEKLSLEEAKKLSTDILSGSHIEIIDLDKEDEL